MNEDLLNMGIRSVSSQRAIENAVHEALKSGKLRGKKSIKARVTVTIDGLGLKHEIADDVTFE